MTFSAITIITLVVSIAAAALMLWALLGDHGRGEPRCARCGYDTGGLPALRCPECGHIAQSSAEWERRTQRIRLARAATVCCSASLSICFAHRLLPLLLCNLTPEYLCQREYAVGSFQIKEELKGFLHLDSAGPQSRVRIIRDGKTIYLASDQWAWAGISTAPGLLGGQRRGLGDDINNDGLLDIVIGTGDGGCGCGNHETHEVLSYDPMKVNGGLIHVATFEGGSVEDVDGDGTSEWVSFDDSYCYEWTDGAGSPLPRVALRWTVGGRTVAWDLMAQEPPTDESLCQEADELVRQWENGHWWPDRVIRRVIELIYQGNARSARRLLELCLAERGAELRRFWEELPGELRRSRYLADRDDLTSVFGDPDDADMIVTVEPVEESPALGSHQTRPISAAAR